MCPQMELEGNGGVQVEAVEPIFDDWSDSEEEELPWESWGDWESHPKMTRYCATKNGEIWDKPRKKKVQNSKKDPEIVKLKSGKRNYPRAIFVWECWNNKILPKKDGVWHKNRNTMDCRIGNLAL